MSELLFSSPVVSNPLISAIRACPFDLVARAELAIDGCTGLTNSQLGGQPYTYAEFHTDPPVALHAPWDYADSAGRLLEGLTLARIMNGSAPDHRDEALALLLASCQREDGLIALPPTPWTHAEPLVEMDWSQRGALMAWTTRYVAADDSDAIQRAELLVQGLHRAAVWEGDTCWFPDSFLPARGWTSRLAPIGKMRDVLIGAQVIFPLARVAEITGNKQAHQLAHGLIRFLKERSGAFTPDGNLTEKAGHYFHSNTAFILGTLKYGVVAGRGDLVDWARSAFNHAMEWGTEFGFFPHRLAGEDRWRGDVCATADMVEIALLLGMHADPLYFAYAERFGRNHLLESQLLDFDWVEQGVDAPFCQDMWCAQYPEEGLTTQDVCYRALGGFAGWSRLNDAFDPANPRLMQRCTGSGIRALYDLWHYTAQRPEGAVRVNLHFSRDTRWATVTSRVPQEGCVEVMMKTRGVLAVRIPSEVTANQITLTVNDNPRAASLRNGYVLLEALHPGDVVTVKWLVAQRNVSYTTDTETLNGLWQGDTLIYMSPPGLLSPLYNREPDPPVAPSIMAHGPVKEIDTL